MLKDALRDLYKEVNLRLMRTSTPATKAFGSAFRRSLQTGAFQLRVEEGGRPEGGRPGQRHGAPVLASGEEVDQPAGSSQLASAPSSADAIASVGIQVRRTRYFLLLKIDGLLMWQWFG